MMATFPKRYEIYFADLNPTVGGEIRKVRPVVVVSQNEMNQFLDTVVVCPLTSVLHRQWRSRLQIQCAGKEAEIAATGGRRGERLPRRLSDPDEGIYVVGLCFSSHGFSQAPACRRPRNHLEHLCRLC